MEIYIVVALLVIVILLILLAGRGAFSQSQKQSIYSTLRVLENSISSAKSDADRRDAVVRLDNLLSRVLKKKFNNQQSCGENLKRCKTILSREEYSKIWEKHKIRNRIVHEEYTPNSSELSDALKVYKKIIYKLVS